MIKIRAASSKVGVNGNGVMYTKEALEEIVKQIAAKEIPVEFGYSVEGKTVAHLGIVEKG